MCQQSIARLPNSSHQTSGFPTRQSQYRDYESVTSMDATLQAFLISWNWRPGVILVLGVLGGTYVAGWHRLRRRGSGWNAGGGRLALYLTGVTLLSLALLSPIDTFGSFLFIMHMIQHELLTMLVPPLVLLANPFPVMLWGLPKCIRHRAGSLLTRQTPLRRVLWALTLMPVAWLIYVVTLWGWHHPAAYQAALRYELVHDVEHLAFFGTGLLFWWPVINPAPRLHGHIAYGFRIFYVIPAMLQNTFLAALISLSGRVLYPYYEAAPRVWGITPLTDQMMGGIIMWIPGGMTYVITVLVLLAKLFSYEEEQTRQQESLRRQP